MVEGLLVERNRIIFKLNHLYLYYCWAFRRSYSTCLALQETDTRQTCSILVTFVWKFDQVLSVNGATELLYYALLQCMVLYIYYLSITYESSLCPDEDGALQNATAKADAFLELLQLRLSKLGNNLHDTCVCQFDLARRSQGRGKYSEAERLYAECSNTRSVLKVELMSSVIA